MIALVPLLVLGSVVFVEQPIGGVEFDPYLRGGPGQTASQIRCADLDGDGAKDIVTRRSAAFQRGGQFSKAHQVPLPRYKGKVYLDVWGNEIYAFTRDRLESLRWSNSEWQRTLSQPMNWSHSVVEAEFGGDDAEDTGDRAEFGHFVFDVNADSVPEIVCVAADGVHIYAREEIFYEAAAIWDIMPQPRATFPDERLWPAGERSVTVPDLAASAQISVEKAGVWVQHESYVGGAIKVVHRDFRGYTTSNKLELENMPSHSVESRPVDMAFRATSLNGDEIIDLVRVTHVGETAPPLPLPIVETEVSTDGGRTFFSAKSLGSTPRDFAVDFNHDGRLDLITENKRLVQGGIRETLLRGLTRREVDLEVEVRIQDGQNVFPAKPSFSRVFTIELDKPPAYQSVMFGSFLEGWLFSLAGDFDGDGVCDAVIHDKPARITVRKGAPGGLTSEVLATLPASSSRAFAVADVDGDGRSDIITGPGIGSEYGTGSDCTIYLSRDSAP